MRLPDCQNMPTTFKYSLFFFPAWTPHSFWQRNVIIDTLDFSMSALKGWGEVKTKTNKTEILSLYEMKFSPGFSEVPLPILVVCWFQILLCFCFFHHKQIGSSLGLETPSEFYCSNYSFSSLGRSFKGSLEHRDIWLTECFLLCWVHLTFYTALTYSWNRF